MIFTRILLTISAFIMIPAFAEKTQPLNDLGSAVKEVKSLFIGKVERVSAPLTVVGQGKTRESAQANLEFKRKIELARHRSDAEKTSGLGRANFFMRYLGYEAEALPASYRHTVEAPGVGVTVTETFVIRSSYNVLTSRQTPEAKMPLTALMLWVISGSDLPVFETTVNVSVFNLGYEGYHLTVKAGPYIRSDVLSATQYIDRKKLRMEWLVASEDPADENGVRKIYIDEKETAELLNLQSPNAFVRALSLCSRLVGG